MTQFRAIYTFEASHVEEAAERAGKAGKSLRGELVRLTERKETWVGVEAAPANAGENRGEGQPS